MPAHRGYTFLYQQCTRNLTEDGKLKVDAILGDAVAASQIKQERVEAVVGAGWEVG